MEPAKKQEEPYKGSGRIVSAVGSGIILAAPGLLVDHMLGSKGKSWLVNGIIVVLGLLGGYFGWRSASAGQSQFEENAKAHNANVDALGATQQELLTERTRYTEMLKSRGASQGAAVHADKAAAAGAEAVR
jgi:hypothetical protein